MTDAAAPGSDRVLLQAAGLTRRFGGLAAVQNVSIELRRGEVHAVIGTNGAGKSTLVNLLSGELAPSDGASSPDSMLTRVDLPAPLVPITACTSPRRSSIETFCTAASPPKRRVRPAACSSTRSAAGAAASLIVSRLDRTRLAPQLGRQADQTLRHRRDEHDDRQAERQLPVAGERPDPALR